MLWYINRWLFKQKLNRLLMLEDDDFIGRIRKTNEVISDISLDVTISNRELPGVLNTHLSNHFNMVSYIDHLTRRLKAKTYPNPDQYVTEGRAVNMYRFYSVDNKGIRASDGIRELRIHLEQLGVEYGKLTKEHIELLLYYDRLLPSLLDEVKRMILLYGEIVWQVKTKGPLVKPRQIK